MANFIGLVYATLKQEGIDTKGMSTDEAVAKYNELTKTKKQTSEEIIDNIYQFLKTNPRRTELLSKLEEAGINESGRKYFDTVAPMMTLGERANLIQKIYRDKDYRE